MANQDLSLILSEINQPIGNANQARWPLVDSDLAKPQEKALGGKINLNLERWHKGALNAPKYIFQYLIIASELFVKGIFAKNAPNQAQKKPSEAALHPNRLR